MVIRYLKVPSTFPNIKQVNFYSKVYLKSVEEEGGRKKKKSKLLDITAHMKHPTVREV